ncbi:alpha/beta fold hydrolase [Streptomyces sp. NPDC048442]|uniref:alpha/beta hydrolase n=1 Tax=Streptomyces sp. NPDC048442 TaxID=3154823 RepID=UPI00341C96D5
MTGASAVSLVTPTARRSTLRTGDSVSVEAVYEPGPAPLAAPSAVPLFVLAHGFTGSAERPAVRRAARVFAQYGAVITFSFRGHGRSGGRSTVGDREVLDLAAAIAWGRSLGHRYVTTVGFSMGGSVVLRQGALYGLSYEALQRGRTEARSGADGEVAVGAGVTAGADVGVDVGVDARVNAVVAVSAPARWFYRGTAPMRRLHWVVTRPAGRLVGRAGFRTRIHLGAWDPVPLSPVEAAPYLAPTPLLVVHGDRDPYFPLDHPRSLAAAAPGSELWIEPGMGHAENAADAALLARIAEWAIDRSPERAAGWPIMDS